MKEEGLATAQSRGPQNEFFFLSSRPERLPATRSTNSSDFST